jgi:hypothetical protein
MHHFDNPFFVFAIILIVQWLAAYAGDAFRRKVRPLKKERERQDFDIVRTASLTLLGLIIGFSFAMAVSRYDQRKNLEEAEANAIGTEYLRADLLPPDDTFRVRDLLRKYCDERISYYLARDELRLGQIDAETAKLQAELWSVVARVADTQPTPIVGLAVSGMNDVVNAQGYTQAAWWNRIPYYCLDLDDLNRNRVQSAIGIWRASYNCVFANLANCRFDFDVSDRGHR